VFGHLQIYDPRERMLVGLADAGLTVVEAVRRLAPARRPAVWPPRRILLLRLERIGDLLMSAPAIAAVRAFAPDATIDLVVGSWNASIARLIPGIDRVETLDAAWLARGSGGLGMRGLLARARQWRAREYDLAINFEGDVRSHLLLASSGAPERAGFTMAGGGPLLTRRFEFRPDEHTTENAWRLVRGVLGRGGGDRPNLNSGNKPVEAGSVGFERAKAATVTEGDKRGGDAGAGDARRFRLVLPALARERAAAIVGRAGPVIALHASGGRAIKQWPPARFADAAARSAGACDPPVLLRGAPGDRAIVDEVRAAMPADIATIDLVGEIDLPILAAILERCQLVITGDTGPMHLAAAVGAPIVAVFGPSMPVRYAPIAAPHRIVRIDLPCAPCNMIRLPPQRCQGHTPDCLEGVTVDAVVAAATDLLREMRETHAVRPANLAQKAAAAVAVTPNRPTSDSEPSAAVAHAERAGESVDEGRVDRVDDELRGRE
jgi:ADP-heptose:LPS heptosyltransferase